MLRHIRIILGMVWAFPYTLIGLCIGAVGICSGGRGRVRGRVIEFHGGFVAWVVRHLPAGPTTLAVTLGHTILGQTDASLDIAHNHEMIHVGQFERWGPIMGPAYLLASLYVWIRGGQAYRDNPFEKEAYRNDDTLE